MPDETATTMQPDVLTVQRPALSAVSDMPDAEPPPSSEPAEAPAEPAAEPAAEPVVEPAAEPAEPAAEPREPSPIRKRFSELTAERNAADQARREAEAREARISERLEKLIGTLEPKPEAPPEDVRPARPDKSKFDDPDAYDAAMAAHVEEIAEWSARNAVKQQAEQAETQRRETETAAQRQREEDAAAAQRNTVQAEWQKRQEAALEKYPDFEDVVYRDEVPINEVAAATIMQHEQGPDIAYFLGQHPEEAARIAAMNVPNTVFPAGHPKAGQPFPDIQRQIFELGKIAAQFSEPVTKLPPVLPPPVRPLRSNSGAAVSNREPTVEEYAAQRLPQLQAERRASTFGRVN